VIPETRFAPSSEGYLAYQVIGEGVRDIVLHPPAVSHLEFMWEVPEATRNLRRLVGLGRVIMFDSRGVGMSERTTRPVSVEQRSDDIVAVMDAAASKRAVLCGSLEGAAVVLVTAARYPDRVESVIAAEAMAAARPDATHPWGYNAAILEQVGTILESGGWGEAVLPRLAAPALADDPRIFNTFKRIERQAATPSMAGSLLRSLLDIDIREYLPAVQAPVLVIHDISNPMPDVRGIRWLAEQLPNARFRQIEDTGVLPWFPGDGLFGEIEEFLEGTRRAGRDDLSVATVLFTDLVGSTEHLVRTGDRGWEATLEAHRTAVRQALARHRGNEIDTAGDGFLAVFALPSDAVRCADEIRSDAATQGLQVRAGMHAGEVVTQPSGVFGVAVHVAARVAARAQPGEVLLTETVHTLTMGAGVEYETAGEHQLKGIPGTWRLYRLRSKR
jgi:class 3 adenylate cyclase/pimeloyl-ACP methyl ester carboxylesterase